MQSPLAWIRGTIRPTRVMLLPSLLSLSLSVWTTTWPTSSVAWRQNVDLIFCWDKSKSIGTFKYLHTFPSDCGINPLACYVFGDKKSSVKINQARSYLRLNNTHLDVLEVGEERPARGGRGPPDVDCVQSRAATKATVRDLVRPTRRHRAPAPKVFELFLYGV